MPHTLQLLGGQPAFAQPLHVGRPNIGDKKRFLQLAEQALDRRWLSNDGEIVRAFESRLQELLGVAHVIAVSNATIGLELALRAHLGGRTGEVIVPSYTFIATAHVPTWCGCQVVFADVDRHTHQLTAASVARCLTDQTVAIMPVHLWGACQATPELEALAAHHGLPLLIDAAHAFHTELDGRKVGHFGQAEVFSFHATKFINSGEGGAITTNDDALAHQLRLMRNFGFAGYDKVVSLGTNAKMNEFSAAMGLTCLESLDQIVARNQANWQAYDAQLARLPGLQLYRYDPATQPNYQYVIVEVDEQQTGLSRDELVAVLQAENVMVRKYFYPGAHRMEPYLTLQPQAGQNLLHTEHLAHTVLALPTGTAVGETEITLIGQLLHLALAQPQAIKSSLISRPA
jgi:dTDP-4-amino-4,6-dideoxygalactose transaminase